MARFTVEENGAGKLFKVEPEGTRSVSVEIRPKSSDKRTMLIGGLTAEVAHDLLNAVVAAMRG
ncbi:hypothetical protein [Nitrospirillum viridazoti]|uniref:Uncharacterized protein n=1 Tax=Nitrospirillum viridazoti CBAmc TaxID=1441467 RepID=A0A248JZ88_9PROT|nr:hypothetical protein [Nitrospirillum amazonense]ASG24037.1 hypothetical protein Y958_24185 [Nitrospirillum amazonense CBAmc]TWB25981.1 hypothetical protein FBZ91_1494 [Nitrospirillum amazonense]